MQPSRKISLRYGIRQMSFCKNQNIFLLLFHNCVQIFDANLKSAIFTIKAQTSPKAAELSQSGKYFFIHNSNNQIFLYDTKTATMIEKIIGAPFSTKIVKFSGNNRKIIYGNTQLLCMWDIVKCGITMRTQNWKNINCFDLNYTGDQFVIGTYNGSIFVMTFVQDGKCSQIQLKRHKTCIMAICYHKQKIISTSYDGHLLISKIETNQIGQKLISYQDKFLEEVPRSIESCGELYYMHSIKGMYWYNEFSKLVGFTDEKSYSVIQNDESQITYIKYDKATIEWWPARLFSTNRTGIIRVNNKENYLINGKFVSK